MSRNNTDRATPRAAGRPGFTLMEILVAVAVLSVTLAGMYQGFGSTVQINAASRGLWRAILFANNELARIERQPPPSVSVSQGEYAPDHPMAGYAWKREVSDEEPLPGVKVRKVRLELTWRVGGIEQRYQAQTYVPSG